LSEASSPSPLVIRYLHGRHRPRKGRGFSLGELKQAGLLESRARSMGVRIDRRRSTIHAQNVAGLTAFLARPTQKIEAPEPSIDATVIAVETKKSASPHRRQAKAKPSKKRKR
jgi:hypothetical protein